MQQKGSVTVGLRRSHTMWGGFAGILWVTSERPPSTPNGHWCWLAKSRRDDSRQRRWLFEARFTDLRVTALQHSSTSSRRWQLAARPGWRIWVQLSWDFLPV